MKIKFHGLLLLLALILVTGCEEVQEIPSTTIIPTTTTSTTTTTMPSWIGTQQFGTASGDYVYALAVDSDDDVYLVGETSAALDGNAHAGGRDIFVAKYAADGTKQWIKQFGTANADAAWGIAVNSSKEVYVAGFTGGGMDGNTNQGMRDVVVVKLSSGGTPEWVRQLGTAADETAYAVALDSSQNVYVAGNTMGSLEGETNQGISDIFLIKYDPEGNRQWIKLSGSASDDVVGDLALDAGNNLYVTGYTTGGLDGNPNAGSNDIFLVKYDAAGVQQWVKQFGTPASEWPYGVRLDGSGNIYIAGMTFGSMEGNANAGDSDALLIKCDASGTKQWSRQFGTSGKDEGTDAAVDSSNYVYMVGYAAAGIHGNTSLGGWDAFLVKYDADGARQWTRQVGSDAPDAGLCLRKESHDYLYLGGTTTGGVDGNTNAGDADVFLMKFSPDGIKQ